MKKFIYSIVTLLILILINIISSKIFNLEFIELSFCVGLTSVSYTHLVVYSEKYIKFK